MDSRDETTGTELHMRCLGGSSHEDVFAIERYLDRGKCTQGDTFGGIGFCSIEDWTRRRPWWRGGLEDIG